MGSIKLPHATGSGSMSIGSPSDDPSGDLELKLPATVGTADQALTNSAVAGTLAFKTLPFSEFDEWSLTANKTSNGYLTNFERVSDRWPGAATKIGTGMTVASDTWSFPSTGKWLVILSANFDIHDSDNCVVQTEVTTDNSSYGIYGMAVDGQNDSSGGTKIGAATAFSFIDVTNTTNVKVKFYANSLGTNSEVRGTTNANDGMQTHFTFIRIGDT
tara:strand:+ start:651 stop:1298 length:648 start_codon:yes stop_codon:yes gene_type:complete